MESFNLHIEDMEEELAIFILGKNKLTAETCILLLILLLRLYLRPISMERLMMMTFQKPEQLKTHLSQKLKIGYNRFCL